jgi:hypothetical protein
MSEPHPGHREAANPAAVRHLLSRWREWWGYRTELDSMCREDIERVAHDLGIGGAELKSLAARGPGAADLLPERMHVLGLTKADVEHVALGLMRDLERTCAFCKDKGACERDLVDRPQSPAWSGYCPNAEMLTAVKVAKQRCPA